MASRIDNEVHLFAEHGLYDGLFLMRDEESGTYWDHMTGEAVYGPMVGRSLAVSNLLQTTAKQALTANPDALVALSDQQIRVDGDLKIEGLLSRVGRTLNGMFQSTVKADDEDTRLPQMDLGLGLWAGKTARYYPYNAVVGAGKALIDTFQGKRVLVFLDPSAYALTAMNVSSDSFEWDGDVIRLGDGSYVEGGVFFAPGGAQTPVERPLQVFTRWYGFSLTFSEPEIYGGGNE